MTKLFRLVRHRDLEDADKRTVHVRLALDPSGRLRLQYRISGEVANLNIPRQANPIREDRLWTHTCFELFIQGAGGSYSEFNFSPSSQWAAYRFNSYRLGMAELTTSSAPSISVEALADSLDVSVDLDLRGLDDTKIMAGSRIALAAVIENRDGDLSYWALKHPLDHPDFHHPDSFVGALSDNGD